MGFWKKLAHKSAYYFLHPLLRFYYQCVLPTSDSARGLIFCGDEIMLIRNIGVERWSLPGGVLKNGEAPETGLLREIKEELDISDVAIEHKLGTYEGKHRQKNVQVHVFVLRTQRLYHKKQWEIDRAGWFTLNQLPSNLSPATARRIGEYKNGKKNLVNEIW